MADGSAAVTVGGHEDIEHGALAEIPELLPFRALQLLRGLQREQEPVSQPERIFKG